ncbi:MAG: hypothetical protein O6945_06585 [Gammaproteobacteria bacterium]|nr:hypothetical protein [Gammaproteobacteria bacterium]
MKVKRRLTLKQYLGLEHLGFKSIEKEQRYHPIGNYQQGRAIVASGLASSSDPC